MPEKTSLDKVLDELAKLPHYFEKKFKEISITPPEDLFKAIKKTIIDLDKPIGPIKPPKSEQYLEEWNVFLKNPSGTAISRAAIKYLCWEADIVNNPMFYRYLSKNIELLSPRGIKGLVTSVHQRWRRETGGTDIIKYTVQQLTDYSGRDRTLLKWKSNIPMILGEKGHHLFAQDAIYESFQDIKIAAENWALFENSDYMRYAVVFAAELCMRSKDFGVLKSSDPTIYVLNTILNWKGLEVDGVKFRYVASKLINHDKAILIKDEIRARIITHPMLGDPRLPSCRNNWNGMSPDAKLRFMGWLAERDIVFFFDHVLKRRDKHGRRSFWLKYVNSRLLIASRSFLSESAAYEIKNFNSDNEKINFGNLQHSGINRAAFILHFGDIVAVEFSEVGKVYIYLREEFEKRFKLDLWTSVPIAESTLKCQYLHRDRMIPHYSGWEYKVTNILSRYGVRP